MLATRRARYTPVKYDVSIRRASNLFSVQVTENAEVTSFTRPTLAAAQLCAACFRPDVCEASNVPFSVFYPNPGGR